MLEVSTIAGHFQGAMLAKPIRAYGSRTKKFASPIMQSFVVRIRTRRPVSPPSGLLRTEPHLPRFPSVPKTVYLDFLVQWRSDCHGQCRILKRIGIAHSAAKLLLEAAPLGDDGHLWRLGRGRSRQEARYQKQHCRDSRTDAIQVVWQACHAFGFEFQHNQTEKLLGC